MFKKGNGEKAGSNDVPRDVREGIAVERDEKKINQLNLTEPDLNERLRRLLED